MSRLDSTPFFQWFVINAPFRNAVPRLIKIGKTIHSV